MSSDDVLMEVDTVSKSILGTDGALWVPCWEVDGRRSFKLGSYMILKFEIRGTCVRE